MRRKITALIVLLVLVITSLSGCSKGDNMETGLLKGPAKEGQSGNGKDKKEEPTMGRYMEQKVTLPELSGNEMILKIIQNKDKQIEVYTMDTVQYKYACYQLQEDMTWKSSTPGWLNNKLVLSDHKVINDLCVGEDGNYYAVCDDYSNNTSKPSIVKSADGGKTGELVKIPYLDKEITDNNYKHYPGIVNMNVLEDGNIVFFDMWNTNSLFVFSPEGKEIDKLQIGPNPNNVASYITSGKDIITVNEDSTGVMFYNTEQKKAERTVDFTNNESTIAYAIKEDGTLLLGNSGGIHRLQKDGTLWETIVDGSLNSMSMPTLSFSNLFVMEGEQEEYYAVYGVSEGGFQLMHYVFDKNVASVPSKEITVYSLRENNTIRQAISLFQAENTDIKVNYVVAMGEEDGKATDYIRALNTELLAGNGADVLVLDGLPVDSYIEKGVLSDIKDLVGPLEESGELLTNITGCYQKDGKVYDMPVRFSIPIIAGKSDAIQTADSLEHILTYIKQTDNKPYLKSTTYNQLLEDCLALYSKDLFQDGQLNEVNFTAFLKNIKSIAENINAAENDKKEIEFNGKYHELFSGGDLFNGSEISIRKDYQTTMLQIKNIYDSMLLFAVLKDKNLGYQSINQKFLPSGLVGLNSKSKESDIAKKFIASLFGTKVQDANVYDGFPVNSKSIQEWTAKNESNISLAVTDEDGNMLSAVWPTKEERDSILKIAMEVKEPIETNYILNSLIVEEVVPFLKGEVTESQAMAAVKAKVNTYLAE